MRPGEPIAGGIGATVLLHAGAALALALGHGGQASAPRPPTEVMVARLVRLGTPRPPQLLPRQPAAAPPAPIAPPIAPQPPAEAEEKPPVPAEKAATPDEKLADLRSAMARARALAARNAPKGDEGDEEPEGRPEGVPEGTADTASEGDAYATEVFRRVHDGWRVAEMVSSRELLLLKATVFLRLADDGRIIEHRLVEPSGNRFFDASVLEAVLRVDRFPPPPPGSAASMAGILLDFNGAEAR